MRKAILFGALCLAFTFTSVSAAEFSGNVTMATDYSFRGISQTSRDPAIQGGFDMEFEGGLSIGTWASNVNFGDSTSQEIDLYVGYSGEITDDVSWGFTFVRFEYPSEGEGLDYNEFQFGLDFSDVSLGFVYSNEFGDGGPSFTVLTGGYSISLGESSSLDLSIGLSSFDEELFGDDEDSYIDYAIGVTTPVAGLDFGIQLVGTDLDDITEADNRVILSLSKSL